jgi:hypothetical protein
MMLLVLTPLACGVLAGYLLGGRLAWLLRVGIRSLWLLWLAAALQYVHFGQPAWRDWLETQLHVSLMVPIFALAGLWVLVNLPGRTRALQAAALVILFGGAMNALVIGLNGEMPYSEAAVRAANMRPSQQSRAESSPKHAAATSLTRLRWLGDVIPVPPIQKVISLGDIVLLLGGAGLIATGMRAPSAADAGTAVPDLAPAFRTR